MPNINKQSRVSNYFDRDSIWIIALSTFFSLFISNYIFQKYHFILNDFSDRTIGIAVLHGINITSRSSLYVKVIIILMAIYLTIRYALLKLKNHIPISFFLKTKMDLHMITILSLSASFSIILGYMSPESIYLKIQPIFTTLTFLNVILLLTKYRVEKKSKIFFNYLNNYSLTILSFLIPLVVFFIRWIVIKGNYSITNAYILPYILLWITFWIFFYFISKFTVMANQKIIITGIILGAIPFLLIPASVVIANELQFTLSNTILNRPAYSYINFSVIFLLSLGVFITIHTILNKKVINYDKYVNIIYLPIFVGTTTLFKMHSNYVELPIIVDMFHHGENLISTQQLFIFNKIPFLEIYPTHGLSYMVGQILYSVINGYKPFEPWLWEWIIKIFEMLLLYVSISLISSPYLATITTVFLPFLDIFGGGRFVYGYNTKLLTTYYFMVFLPSIILGWTINKPNSKKIVLYSVICLFMFFWRIDFGIANLIAGMSVFGTIFIGQKFRNYKSKFKIKQFIIPFVILAVISTSLFFVIAKISDTSATEIFKLNIKYILIQPDAQGLMDVFGKSIPLAIIQYLIYPVIALIYVLIFVDKIFISKGCEVKPKDIFLTYLAIFSLIMLIRSTQRQTLGILGLNQYLFTFLGLSMPLYLIKSKGVSVVSFIILTFTYGIFLPSNTLLIKDNPQISVQNWINRESRVKVNSAQYMNISNFLIENLADNQTFLDLTSSPLLYITTNKEFPNYFIPNAYYTSETIQKNVLANIEKLMKQNQIPIAIVKQPISAANAIDTVPNEIRSYRIYEYLYNNYESVGTIDDYEIWKQKGFDIKNSQYMLPIRKMASNFELHKLPHIWANFDNYNALQNTNTLDRLIISPIDINKDETIFFEVKNKIDKSQGNYIYLRTGSTVDGQITLSYGKNLDKPNATTRFNIVYSDTLEDYLIRVSTQSEWLHMDIDFITVTSDVDIKLDTIEIRSGD